MPGKILIIRFSSIGDIVLTTPVIRCLKTTFPKSDIHFATKKQYVSLLEANPYLSKIHAFEDKQLPDLMDRLDAEKFDLIIDLHNNLRSFLIKTNLGTEHRSFDKLNFQKWLKVNLKMDYLPKKHIVDRYLDTLKDYGVSNDDKGLDYFIPATAQVTINTLPEPLHAGYTAFVIGAQHATKKLPVQKAIELCNQIVGPVILIGGKEDAEAGAQIESGSNKFIYNACGKYNLNQSASLLQQAKRVFAHDTGMMHIAAALKKDVFSIWGNTIPEFGMYPYFGSQLNLEQQKAKNRVLEVANLSCRPCSKIGHNVCPKGHFNCMQQQDFTHLPL